MLFLRQYHRQFCHYFQDLSSKVDIHEDIWGPGHGVNNLTDNNQLIPLQTLPQGLVLGFFSFDFKFHV